MKIGWIRFPLFKEKVCGGLKIYNGSSVSKVDLVRPTQLRNARTLDHTAVIVTNDVSHHDVNCTAAHEVCSCAVMLVHL